MRDNVFCLYKNNIDKSNSKHYLDAAHRCEAEPYSPVVQIKKKDDPQLR